MIEYICKVRTNIPFLYPKTQCFLCRTKIEFTKLCARLQDDITNAGIQPLFEIVKTGHTPWITQQRSQAESDVFSTEGNISYNEQI